MSVHDSIRSSRRTAKQEVYRRRPEPHRDHLNLPVALFPEDLGTSVALTGVSVTTSTGTVDKLNDLALTNNLATSAVGTLDKINTENITGEEATSAVGTIGISIGGSVVLTGEESTGAVGTVDKSNALTLTSNLTTSAVDTPDKTNTVDLTGNISTSAVGTIVAVIPDTAALTSVLSTSAVGNISFTESGSVGLTGEETTSATGTVDKLNIQTITGTDSTSAVGTVSFTESSSVTLSGVQVLGKIGRFSVPINTGLSMFKRDADLYISKDPNATADSSNTIQLRVKDFSFNRDVSIANTARNTMDPLQQRTVSPVVAFLAPVNFSFTTYILPVVDTNVTSPEEYLWVSLMGVDSVTSNSTSSTIDFSNGNVGELRNLTLWFNQPDHPDASYRIDNAIVDSATINFNINGIAEIQWKGRALGISVDSTPPTFTDRTTVTNYLKNKFSTITLDMNSISYTLALTGGSVTFKNNNTFYGRSQIGKSTLPAGHYTGNRTITGNLNFYMKTGSNTSVDLFNELLSNVSNDDYETTHVSNITINVAGITAPYVSINIPQTILGLGRQDFQEVLGVSIPFTAKEDAGNYSTIIYNMP